MMVVRSISDFDIELTEKLLLPEGAHFPEDARTVIRCWNSTDVAACPGSGKTTVLLAKLKILADKMPFENGAGICVLSHTNVAVDEIKTRLSNYADKLLSYPNYIGTIQSFVDKFVTLPYLRKYAGQNVQAVDSLTYAQHMLNRMQRYGKYRAIEYVTRGNYERGGQFSDRVSHTQALYLREDGALCVGKQRNALAGADKPSVLQYKTLIRDLLIYEGIMRYQDAFFYAENAIKELPEAYTDLFSSRFKYVFVDEYQDCNETQRRAIDSIFNPSKCTVMKIGDSDQAIYNSSENETPDWIPKDDFLPIASSNRYSQEIADVICSLKKDKTRITTSKGRTGIKPVLLVYDIDSIGRVLGGFISVLERYGLNDVNGVYKAIGAVKKEESAGLRIGSYWADFDGAVKKQGEYNYWLLIEEISKELSTGKLYKAERKIRMLLCRVFHYAMIKHPITGKDFTLASIKKTLDEEYNQMYRQRVFELSQLQNVNRQTVDSLIRQMINEMLVIMNPQMCDVFKLLPDYFIDGSVTVKNERKEKNVFIDPLRGRRIVFDTVHGVKGETHDATLYLETERQRASDLSRILPYYNVGKAGSSSLYDYSRKLAYVGFSRPKTLLCVAMQAKTFEKSKGVFCNNWEIVDLRN